MPTRGQANWVPVITVDNSVQADLVRELLYEAYIDSMVSIDGRVTAEPLMSGFDRECQILVPQEKVQAARSLLDESYGSVWEDSQTWTFDSDQG